MFYIETELLERDGEWKVVSSAPVKVVAWDRDKYFLYEDSNGNLSTAKASRVMDELVSYSQELGLYEGFDTDEDKCLNDIGCSSISINIVED